MPDYYQNTQSLFIPAAPPQVYEALTDWALRSQWRKGISIEWDGDSKAFLGQKITFKVGGLFPYVFCFRVSGLEPPRRLYMEYSGTLRGRGSLEITPEREGSLVSFHWMKVEPGNWAAKVYFALGGGVRSHRERTTETLRMLRDFLEKGRESE